MYAWQLTARKGNLAMTMMTKLQKLWWTASHFGEAKKAINKGYKRFLADVEREERYEEFMEIIRQSDYFDEAWYLRNHIELQDMDMDPARHYLLYSGSSKNPSPFFCNEEYQFLHSDVANAKTNPLLHYEMHGKNEKREISIRQLKSPVFPDESKECARSFSRKPVVHRRTCITSCFFADGRISETLLFLLRGLREVADNIILIGDCQVIPEELDKLADLVCYASFGRHEQYDFGSYKRGLAYARENDLLNEEDVDELILINDSCYGPIYPFKESFDPMSEDFCDFWGYAGYSTAHVNMHISTYFLVFKRTVIDQFLLDEFLSRVEGKLDRGAVITLLETQLTNFLVEHGLLFTTTTKDLEPSINGFNYPLTFLKDCRVPLVKKKAFLRRSAEDLDEVIEIIAKNAPELVPFIVRDDEPRDAGRDIRITLEEHRASFPEKVAKLRKKMESGSPLNALFFVTSVSMFSARPILLNMMKDKAFAPRIVVIPDFRRGDDTEDAMEACREELLLAGYPEEIVTMAEHDDLDRWNDVCEDADLVFYSLPYYQVSSFRYSPFYSVGRDFLPLMVNYGFYRSLYDRKVLALDAYAYMWKAFFECEETADEYRKCSPIAGENTDLVGYVKMDPLAVAQQKSSSGRKTILVALHHSIEGGSNDTLALANFLRYFDYFKELPDRYPDVDFIYRPHPFLFDTLKRVEEWTEMDVRYYIREMSSKHNVTWSDGGDYFAEFAQSDACIQDCGSFLVEYFYTGNPCCYMLKEPEDIDSKFSLLGKKCLEQCYVSYDTDAIDAFIRDVVLEGNDTKHDSRMELVDHIRVNYPHAAEIAVEHIKKAILDSEAENSEE